jgi:Tol biopolymer transport system component
MPLVPGTRIGSYEVVALLGAGGMGEVYRARDARLDRHVALKILPESFAADSDRLARFEREARTLASLSHPNIATIYGAEHQTLVMELVEGEDLSALISRAPLALPDAVAIAAQIADALEAAHESGVVHRDLKPANVKVRADGTVKVLDFGLAKALTPDFRSGSPDPANSPTLTAQATQLGMILGTAAYMAPEQAKGKPVDKRADIWAFGVVLFEMLTGRRLFDGDSVVETMGFVATRDPDWTALPPATPAAVRRLLRRCLTRDPKQRLRDIGEARIALAQPDAAALEPASSASAGLASGSRTGILAAAGALIVAALAGGWYLGSANSAAPETAAAPFHSEIAPTPDTAFGRQSTGRIFAFTPDGRALIYASTDPASRRLYRRDRDSDVAVPIAGTEGGYGPFMSPDGRFIGFFAAGQMKSVPLAGGTTAMIRDFRVASAADRLGLGFSTELGGSQDVGYGAAWLEDNTIVYGRFAGGLWRISADGGTPTPLKAAIGDGEIAHRVPHALPGGRAILCTVIRDLIAREESTVEAIELATGARTVLVRDATDGRFVPGGYLLFARSGALYSVRFDPAQLVTSGDPVKVSDTVMHAIGGGSPARASGVAQFDVSSDGILAVLHGGMIVSPNRVLVWTSGGRTEALPGPSGGYLGPRLSRDGSRIGVRFAGDIVTLGSRDGFATPVAKSGIFPVWHPDDSRIFAALREQTRQNIYSLPLSGGAPDLIASSQSLLWPSSVSRDGKTLFYVESNMKSVTGNDIWSVGLSPKSASVALLATTANESYPMISPDGQWLAYVVGDGTTTGIYVRAYPGPGPVERISEDGGIAPVWSDDGAAIFYGRLPAGESNLHDIVRVSLTTRDGRISVGAPTVVATGPFNYSTPVSSFDVTRDGTRILASRNVEPAAGTPAASAIGTTIRLIVNPSLGGRRERK